ncbi:hypothetical protein [Pseudomonas spelaei]
MQAADQHALGGVQFTGCTWVGISSRKATTASSNTNSTGAVSLGECSWRFLVIVGVGAFEIVPLPHFAAHGEKLSVLLPEAELSGQPGICECLNVT